MSTTAPPPPPPGAGPVMPPSPPVLQPVMAAGGRVRRLLNNSSTQSLGLFVVAVAGAWWFLNGGKHAPAPDVRASGMTHAAVQPDDLPPKPPPPRQESAPPPMVALPPPEPIRSTVARPTTPAGPPPALVSSKGQVRSAPPPGSTVRAAAYLSPSSTEAVGGVAYKAPTVPGWEAIAVGDLERTLKPGTDIACTLNHAIDGTHPGDFSCVVARDVYGWAYPPRLALIHAGDVVRGSYRPLSPGENRLLGMSAFVEVTFGDKALMVPLGSAPVEDSLGRTGMEGYVESRFWERLGNAIITDIGSEALRLPANAVQATGSGLQVSANTSEQIVGDTLRTQTNTVHPLFRKNQGDTINIRVTAPIHFGALQYEAVQ